jgi:hypothetical protein
MMRASLFLLLGAAVGATSTYGLIVRDRAQPAGGSSVLSESVRSSTTQSTLINADWVSGESPHAETTSVVERLAIYEFVTTLTDVAELESLIERAASRRTSHARSFGLDALLARLAEVDPARAIRLADELHLETRFRVPLYQVWAGSDTDAALDALRSVGNSAEARAIGLGLIAVLGDDERAIARVLTALPNTDALSFRIDVLGEKAESAPLAALQQALAMEDPVARNRAIGRVAASWAQQDPEAALAQIYAIQVADLRTVFHADVLRQWASLDPERVLAYLSGSDNASAREVRVSSGALRAIAESAPERLLTFADRLPPEMRRMAQQVALQVLAQRDPVNALSYVDTLPQGQEREQVLQAIANGYARRDAESALAWARSLQPASPAVMNAVLGGIAEGDIDRALDLALAAPSAMEQQQAVQSIVMRYAMQGGERARAIADRLVRFDDTEVGRPALEMVVSMWSSRNAESALEWVLANSERVNRAVVSRVGQSLGAQDPAAAVRYTDRIPEELRGDWISMVAEGYARVNPEDALAWIARFQGQPGYEAGVAAIAQHSAQFDARSAARLLDSLPGSVPASTGAAAAVANRWAHQDPNAAAQWALGVRGLPARTAAVSGVAAEWAARDSVRARAWVMSLPSGTLRDSALGSMIASAARDGTLDEGLLDAFNADIARQQALLRASYALAQRDPEQTRALIGDYITDPTLRQQAEQALENAQRSGAGMYRFAR